MKLAFVSVRLDRLLSATIRRTSERKLYAPYRPGTNGYENHADGRVIGKSRQYHTSTRRWNSPVELDCLDALGAEHPCQNVEGVGPGCEDNAIYI